MAFLFVFCWDSDDSNVGAFNPFTFRAIIDKNGPVAIWFVVLGSRSYNLSVFPVREDPLAFVEELVWWC